MATPDARKPQPAPTLADSAPDIGDAVPANGGPEGEPEKTAADKRAERTALAKQDTAGAQQALATLGEVEASELMPFSPKSFEEAWKLAHHLSNSKVVPEGLRGNGGAVLSVMARGAVLGVHWSVAVQAFYTVYDKVSIPADILAGCCDSDPAFEYFEVVEATDSRAVVEAKKKRWTEPRQYVVTIEEAITAGYLDGKHSALWGKVGGDGKPIAGNHRRRTMLAHMAQREAARLWNPARFAGLYTPDELHGLEPEMRVVTPPASGSATASLERFGTAPPRALAASTGHAAAEEAPTPPPPPPAPAVAGTPTERPRRMSPAQIAEVRKLATQAGVSVDELEGYYAARLAEIEIEGQDATGVERSVVDRVRAMAARKK
jgi:hypothetical protein